MGFFSKKKKSKVTFDANKYIKWFPEPRPLPQTNRQPEWDDFSVTNQIGKGSYSKVLEVQLKSSGERFALKVMSKKTILSANCVDQVKREIKILSRISHPNIIQYISHFEDYHHIFILLELGDGCHMFEDLRVVGRFPEHKAVKIIFKVLCAAAYLHSQEPAVMHRDIKPENLVIIHNEEERDFGVKLIDFGWSSTEKSVGRRTFCGTRDYMAPEIVEGVGHFKGVDVWSIGVVFYEMLVGTPPFYPDLPASAPLEDIERKLMDNILFKEPHLPDYLTELAKDLITKLLCKDHSARMTAEEILGHQLFEKYGLYVRASGGKNTFEACFRQLEGQEDILDQAKKLEKSICLELEDEPEEQENLWDDSAGGPLRMRLSSSFTKGGVSPANRVQRRTMSVRSSQLDPTPRSNQKDQEEKRNEYKQAKKKKSKMRRLFGIFSSKRKSKKSKKVQPEKAPTEVFKVGEVSDKQTTKTGLPKVEKIDSKIEKIIGKKSKKGKAKTEKIRLKSDLESRKMTSNAPVDSNGTSVQDMTISEFLNYDPVRAMQELKSRYRRVKSEKRELIKAIGLKNKSIKALESQIEKLKKLLVMNKETGKEYTQDEVQALLDMRNEFWKLSKENRDLRSENKELTENLNLTKIKVFTLENSLKRNRKQDRIQAKIEKYHQKSINEKNESSEEEEESCTFVRLLTPQSTRIKNAEPKNRYRKSLKKLKIPKNCPRPKPKKTGTPTERRTKEGNRSFSKVNTAIQNGQGPQKFFKNSPKSDTHKLANQTNMDSFFEEQRSTNQRTSHQSAQNRLNMDGIIFTLDRLTKSIFGGFQQQGKNSPLTKAQRDRRDHKQHIRAYSCSSNQLKGLNLAQISKLINELRDFFSSQQQSGNGEERPSVDTGGRNTQPMNSLETTNGEDSRNGFLTPEGTTGIAQGNKMNLCPILRLDEVLETKMFESQSSFGPSMASELNSRDLMAKKAELDGEEFTFR